MARAQNGLLAPIVFAGILVGLGGVLALHANSAATEFLPALNTPTPTYAEAEPHTGYAPPRLSQRVVLVIIDGLRLRNSFGYDFLDQLRRKGVDAAASSHYPTISRPNYVSILTGVPPNWSGVRNNWFDFDVTLDSLMDRANAAGLPSAYVADIATSGGRMFRGDFEDIHVAPWAGGLEKALGLSASRDYPLIVVIPGAVDAAGHEHGAAGPEYLAAIEEVDRMLAGALAGFDLERDTIIITGDHGHTDRGGHGGLEPDVVEVPLIMAGAGISPGVALAESRLVDVAPTVASLLGVSPPGHGFGRTLTAALVHDDTERARIEASDSERIARNERRADELSEAGRADQADSRKRRLAVLAALVAACLGALWLANRLGAIKIDGRVLLVAVPAFPLAYYALLDLLFQHYSLSAISNKGDTVERLFRFGLASTAVQVVAAWIALGGRSVVRNRLAAANGLIACGMFVAIVPALWMWSMTAAGPFVEAPSSAASVLVPATYMAVAAYAVAAAITLGLEIVVFFARAVDPRIPSD